MAESQTKDVDDVWGTQSSLKQPLMIPPPVVVVLNKTNQNPKQTKVQIKKPSLLTKSKRRFLSASQVNYEEAI